MLATFNKTLRQLFAGSAIDATSAGQLRTLPPSLRELSLVGAGKDQDQSSLTLDAPSLLVPASLRRLELDRRRLVARRVRDAREPHHVGRLHVVCASGPQAQARHWPGPRRGRLAARPDSPLVVVMRCANVHS